MVLIVLVQKKKKKKIQNSLLKTNNSILEAGGMYCSQNIGCGLIHMLDELTGQM